MIVTYDAVNMNASFAVIGEDSNEERCIHQESTSYYQIVEVWTRHSDHSVGRECVIVKNWNERACNTKSG